MLHHNFSYCKDDLNKSSLKIPLQNIKGIGVTTVEKILRHFGSITNAKKANDKELVDLIGKNKALKILKKF